VECLKKKGDQVRSPDIKKKRKNGVIAEKRCFQNKRQQAEKTAGEFSRQGQACRGRRRAVCRRRLGGGAA